MHGKHGAQDRVTAGLLHDDIRVLALEVAPRSAQSFESGCSLILRILRRCRGLQRERSEVKAGN